MADTSSKPNNTGITSTSGLEITEEITKLAKIFPQFVKDGEIDFDAIKAWFSENAQLAESDEKYGLGWTGKAESVQAIRRSAKATLKPDEENSVDWSSTRNIFVEGDNLETLKLLLRPYAGKIKMIYIDPPYNTGADFIYKDSFQEGTSDFLLRSGQDKEGSNYSTNSSTSGRFHSNWLSMMYPRLFYAKQMLSEDGVIFVSIDYHENFNLRQIMNEVFGDDNFVGEIYWESKTKSQNTETAYNKLQPKAEMILAYTKGEMKRFNVIAKGEKEYPESDDKGEFRYAPVEQMSNNGIRSRNTMVYEILGIEPRQGKQWQLGLETIEKYKDRGDLLLRDENPVIKIRPIDERTDKTDPFWGLFTKEIGTAESAKKELAELIPGNGFETVKPTELIKRLVFHSTGKDDIIMDFFSGSGTTAQAVMELNAEDDGTRKHIQVQLPELIDENSVAYTSGFKTVTDITRERMRRAGKKVKESYKDKLKKRKEPLDTGFKAFKLSVSNLRQWQPVDSEADNAQQLLLDQAKESVDQPLVDDYKELDVVYEIALKEGADLNSEILEVTHKNHKIYTVTDTDRKIVVTFAGTLNSGFAEGLGLGANDLLVCLDSSLTDADKANLLQNIKLKTI